MLLFMSRGQIAEYLGVTVATVKQWVDFPPADARIGRNHGWQRETVDAYARRREAAGQPIRGRNT